MLYTHKQEARNNPNNGGNKMKQNINLYDFREAFRNMNRTENFSYAGLEALFNFLEEYEDNTGEEIELDVIALCCEFSEYASLEEFNSQYTLPDQDDYTLETLQDNTTFIPIGDDAFIIQDF